MKKTDNQEMMEELAKRITTLRNRTRAGIHVFLRTRLLCCLLLLLGLVGAVSAVGVDSDGARIFSVSTPAPGVHPRVFFTAEESKDLRGRIEHTTFGQKRLQPLMIESVRSVRKKLKPLLALDMNHLSTEDVNGWFKPEEGLHQDWGVAAIQAYLYGDDDLRSLLIDAAVRHAQVVLVSLELTPDHPFWANTPQRGVSDAERNWDLGHEFTFGRGITMTYDLLYDQMTDSQRDTVRRAIAVALEGRKSHGLGWVETKLFSNHVPLHAAMGTMALAIEGEEGYDPQLYTDWVNTLRSWGTLCVAPGGANHEDGYIYYAMRGAAAFMVAAQRRGDELFNIPNLRNILTWQAHWEPVGLQGPALGGYQTYHVVMNYMYPEDPTINMFWRRRVGADYSEYLHGQSKIDTVLFGTDWTGDPVVSADPGALGLEPYAFDQRRGVQIVRNSWKLGDLQFRYSARPDTMFVGHAAVDTGSFDLEALGRKWAYTSVGDKVGSFNSKDFSMVHIDGQAAGMKPPPVKNLFQQDAGAATVIASDLTYAWNWCWYYGWPQPGKQGDSSSGDQANHGLPGSPWEPEHADPYELGWPAEENWLPRDLSEQPDLGYVGIWQFKTRINDVKHVYRTAITVRGEQPYVLIVDDVQKDDQSHLYEWYMQIPSDLGLGLLHHQDIVIREQAEGLDIDKPLSTGGLFQQQDPTTTPGAKRLLVRVLDPYKDLPEIQPDFYNRPNFLQAARLEEHQYGYNYHRGQMVQTTGKRLVVPYRGIAGDFKVLLFPYQTTNQSREDWQAHPQGAAMPETVWNQEGTQLTVTLGDQVDIFSFDKGVDGRTRVGLARNRKNILEAR